jgi:hypothetical protein
VPEGNWAEEIPLPPSLAGTRGARQKYMSANGEPPPISNSLMALDTWEDAMINAQNAYAALIDLGVPAEEARGVLPHDMPTRIHWVCDLRTLLAEAGKRTCTQAQFPWRMIFAGMASALRKYEPPYAAAGPDGGGYCDGNHDGESWQFKAIADALRPVCFQTGKCGFMAQFDRSCSIRERVDANARIGRDPSEWGTKKVVERAVGDHREMLPIYTIEPIHDYEWAADPGAARS